MKTTIRMWLAVLLIFGSAQAGALPKFSDVDTDGDGEITREEARAAGLSEPGRLDANGDGRIDMLEYRSAREAADSGSIEPRSLTDYPPAAP